MTAIGLTSGLLATFLFSTGERVYGNIAGGLFILAMFMDHLDGEYARLTARTTRLGYYFDRISSATVYTSVFIGIGIGQQMTFAGVPAFVVGLVAGISIALIFLIRNQAEYRGGGIVETQGNDKWFETEDCMYLLAVIAWVGQLDVILLLAAAGAPLYLLWTIFSIRRKAAAKI